MSLLTYPPFVYLVVPAVAVPGNGDAAVLHAIVDFVKCRTYQTELSFEVVDRALEFQLDRGCQSILIGLGVAATGGLYLLLLADRLFGTVSLLPVFDLLS